MTTDNKRVLVKIGRALTVDKDKVYACGEYQDGKVWVAVDGLPGRILVHNVSYDDLSVLFANVRENK